ncbi:hypothetical protein KR200_002247, partial [Drosophila serrata]
NNSHISLRTELKIVLEKQTEAEEQHDLGKITEKRQERATEVQENLSTSQKTENQESSEDLDEDLEEFLTPESSGDTSSVHKKFSQSEEARDSEEDLRPQEGCGDTEDLSANSSFLSCSSYEQLRQSILKRDRRTSTLNFRSLIDLDFAEDLETTFSGVQLSCASSTSSIMKGRSLSLTPNSSERAIDVEINKSVWPYFKRSDIDSALSVFKQVDEEKNGYISLCGLKRFLELLEIPQTHLKTKKMMAQVVKGQEDRLNFSDALLIYGSLKHRLVPLKWKLQHCEKGQIVICDEVDVAQVGVSGAKLFFEAKIALQT